jgi:hypothetical protein
MMTKREQERAQVRRNLRRMVMLRNLFDKPAAVRKPIVD